MLFTIVSYKKELFRFSKLREDSVWYNRDKKDILGGMNI